MMVWLGLFSDLAKSYGATYLVLLSVAFGQEDVATYWVIVGISRAMRMYRQYQQREKEALRLELNAASFPAGWRARR